MTEQSMFFADGSYYSQNVFAQFLKDIFGHDGVVDNIGNELLVEANTPTNMAVKVNTGRSYVQGYIHEILTDAVQLAIADADTTNPRIDRVVLRLDVSTNRRIRVAVLTGTPAATPVAPTLTQTDSIWEISLAQVYVDANATAIASGKITDERQYMWFSRDNMPKATTSELGSVKVGTGLTVSDGLLSLSENPILISHTSLTNNEGFAIGKFSMTVDAFSGTVFGSSTWANIGSQYAIASATPTIISYSPFTATHLPGVTISPTATASGNAGSSGGTTVGWRVIRVSTSEVLSSKTKWHEASSSGFSDSFTMTITIPEDWDYTTDKIQFQGMASGDGWARIGFSVTSGTATGTIYYRPSET